MNLITVIQVKGHLSLFLESLVNKPPLDLSSLKRPDSRTLPDSKTKILSQFSMVLILWAMIMVVRPSMALFKAYWTFFCESSSRAEVASSRISIFGFLMIVLAIATLCFWPPERLPPREPQTESNPESRVSSLSERSLSSTSPTICLKAPSFYSCSSTFLRTSISSSYFS